MAKVYIGLGANLGNREANIRNALALLWEMDVAKVVRVSGLIETRPVGGPPGQGNYLNGAAEIETWLSPFDLLEALKIVETRAGRVGRERWAAREVDLDILLCENEVIESPLLQVPHPRMFERKFVLRPLAQIAPAAVNPVTGMTVAEHLARLLKESPAE